MPRGWGRKESARVGDMPTPFYDSQDSVNEGRVVNGLQSAQICYCRLSLLREAAFTFPLTRCPVRGIIASTPKITEHSSGGCRAYFVHYAGELRLLMGASEMQKLC